MFAHQIQANQLIENIALVGSGIMAYSRDVLRRVRVFRLEKQVGFDLRSVEFEEDVAVGGCESRGCVVRLKKRLDRLELFIHLIESNVLAPQIDT